MPAEVKKLFDESIARHGGLDGKAGAAFATAANVGGGAETTILDILHAMLIHGMVLQGDPQGAHYGPLAVAVIDKQVENACARMAGRFAKLLGKLAG
jgi:NAD(P)H dehydrogenase (quinone)